MKVLVMGATGGSGRAAVAALLAAGHEVTAFSRRASTLAGLSVQRLRTLDGDATDAQAVARAVQGHDAVVVTLGISESALRVRLLGAAAMPNDVRSAGTRNVIAAMREHGARRLVVQSSFGVGETRTKLPLMSRLIFALLLKPQIADTEQQEREVRASGLDWVLVQPVNLTDEQGHTGRMLASPNGEILSLKVPRQRVGAFLAEAAQQPAWLRRSVALSAAAA